MATRMHLQQGGDRRMSRVANCRTGPGGYSRRLWRVGLVAFGAALAFVGAARAQTSTATGGQAGLAGVPTGTDRVAIDVNAGAAYDTNVTGGNPEVAAARHLVPEDETYTLGTDWTLQLPSSRQTLFLEGAAELQRHEKNSILDAENYNISAGAVERLGLCTGTGIAGYSHRQTLIEDLAVATTKNIATEDTGTADVVCGRRKLYFEVQGGGLRLVNDALTAGFINSTTENASASVGYRGDRLGNLSLTGQYSDIDYSQNALLHTATPSVRQYSAGVKYTRIVGLRLTGSVGVFYNRIEGGFANIHSDGLNANASLGYRLTSKTQFALDYSLGNAASPLTNSSYVRTQVLQLTGAYTLTQRISFHVIASRTEQDYLGVQQVAILQFQQSTTDLVSGGMDVRVGRKATISLNVSHTNRVANVSEFNFTDDRVAVTLSNRF